MRPLSDQDRLQMLRHAGAAERRNSPRSLVVLAILVLLVAGVYAALGWSSRQGTLRSLRAAQGSQGLVQIQLSELDALRAPDADREGVVVHPRMASPVALLERAAQAAEFPEPKYDSERIETDAGDSHRRIFRFKEIRSASAEDVLRWVDRVERDIPGMRVYSMDLRVGEGKRGWDVTVQFSRLEKKQ